MTFAAKLDINGVPRPRAQPALTEAQARPGLWVSLTLGFVYFWSGVRLGRTSPPRPAEPAPQAAPLASLAALLACAAGLAAFLTPLVAYTLAPWPAWPALTGHPQRTTSTLTGITPSLIPPRAPLVWPAYPTRPCPAWPVAAVPWPAAAEWSRWAAAVPVAAAWPVLALAWPAALWWA